MIITNCTPADLDLIFAFYDDAIAYQKQVFGKHWLGFERAKVAAEIAEQRQWKIVVDNQVACIFLVTFRDSLIWQERDNDESLYLHRIVTHSNFRGRGFVKDIVEWARQYAPTIGKKFIRLDTWGDNQKLIDYYLKHGFTFLGVTQVANTAAMPKHYEGISLSLFEIVLP